MSNIPNWSLDRRNERSVALGKEVADYGGSDDSNDEDYDDMNDAAIADIQYPLRSRKRFKRAKGMEHNDLEHFSIATSPVIMPESEEIPIRGYVTLKSMGSKVVYTLTFSQEELLLERGGLSPRQGIPRRDSEHLSLQEKTKSRHVRNSRFSAQEDKLLLQLKGDGLSWDEISHHFSERSKGTLQVHYSTKLRPRVETLGVTKKRRRSG